MSDADMYRAMEAGTGAYWAYDPREDEEYKDLTEYKTAFIGTLNEKLLNKYKEYDENHEFDELVEFISECKTCFNKKQLQAAIDFMSIYIYYIEC